jgi:hypothetical protein
LHSLPGACSLESEDDEELTPPSISNGFCQVSVLRHVANPQILVIDHIKPLDEHARYFVLAVAALSSDMLVSLGEERHCFASANAPLLATAHLTLATTQIRFGFTVMGWSNDAFPICARCEGFQSEVNRSFLTSVGQWLNRRLRARNGDIPPIGLLGDGNGLRSPFDRTGPVYANAPNLGEHENAVVQLCPVAILLEREAMVASAGFEAWETCLLASLYPREERQICLIQPRKHILENVNVDVRILWKFCTNEFELGFLVIP